MKFPYEDILHLSRPAHPHRPRMSAHDRAAQFSPFAALTGYEEAIQEMRRTTEAEVELFGDGVREVDEMLAALEQIQKTTPRVNLVRFLPDRHKSGGSYETVTGRVKKVDPVTAVLVLTDGKMIRFSQILGIDSPDVGKFP